MLALDKKLAAIPKGDAQPADAVEQVNLAWLCYLKRRYVATPLPPEMTTTQAAEFLDVSRPFIIKLVKRGELPCRMVGTHRRIPSAALLEQREKMFQRARADADEMSRIAQDLGLYEEVRPAKVAITTTPTAPAAATDPRRAAAAPPAPAVR